MRILRVFVRRTSYTPTDELAFVGPPPFAEMIPEHDEVHVSCTFTWDMDEAEDLAFQWEGATNKPVKLGGPAYHSPADDFTPGLYVRKGIIFTSRGCNNNCPWCGVRQIEGKLREMPTCEGNILQDNNFLQCSRQHKDKVFNMLRSQREFASAADWRQTLLTITSSATSRRCGSRSCGWPVIRTRSFLDSRRPARN